MLSFNRFFQLIGLILPVHHLVATISGCAFLGCSPSRSLLTYKFHRVIRPNSLKLFRTMAKAKAKKAGKKVPCTCGCRLDVAPSTKQNHLNGKGTTALRARVFAETKSLTMIDGPQHERQNNRNPGSKKQPASNPDEGICKRLKASQLEPSPEPNLSSTFLYLSRRHRPNGST